MNLIRILILLFLHVWSFSASDSEVSCVLTESCVLPCSFQSTGEDVIHWFLGTGQRTYVHSFYSNQDQLGFQNQNYTHRTSLFRDQISRGNASLLLRGVKVQDEGTYECSISTIRGKKSSLVYLRVDAPVSQVNIHQVENRITCSSEGIYPEPELTWSTIPPLNTTLQTRTRVHQTEEQLYSISSSLVAPDGGSDLTYSCSIRTSRNQRSSSVRRVSASSSSSSEASISCSASSWSLFYFVFYCLKMAVCRLSVGL